MTVIRLDSLVSDAVFSAIGSGNLDGTARTNLEHRSVADLFRPARSRHRGERPPAMLTRKQHELLALIDQHLKQTGFSPSFEEMKDALKLKSKSGIHRLISALEERGFLGRRHHRARALEVLRLPENSPRAAATSRRSRRPVRRSRPT